MKNFLAGKRIFIIEDNVFNGAIMRDILERCGSITFFDRYGDNALSVLKEATPIDLVILDLMLSHGKSGYEMYDLIRSLPGYETIPIVLVTSADPATEMNTARKKGFNGFIAKPIRVNTFPAFLRGILEGKPIWVSQS
jgi:two-component system cell cycle response regulator DivK